MRTYSTHELKVGDHWVVSHAGREYLALVDLASYDPFVAKNADHLDIMVHLAEQTRALTALCWDAPSKGARLRFIVTEDSHMAGRLGLSYGAIVGSGSIRSTQGELCLTSRDRIEDCARHRSHTLLRGGRLSREEQPVILAVPPGIYDIQVFRHRPAGSRGFSGASREAGVDFSVVLMHYSFPAPRIAPMRLPGLSRWGSAEEPVAAAPAASLHADPTRRWRQS